MFNQWEYGFIEKPGFFDENTSVGLKTHVRNVPSEYLISFQFKFNRLIYFVDVVSYFQFVHVFSPGLYIYYL